MSHAAASPMGPGGGGPASVMALDLIKAITAYIEKMIMSKETAGMKALVLDKETVRVCGGRVSMCVCVCVHTCVCVCACACV